MCSRTARILSKTAPFRRSPTLFQQRKVRATCLTCRTLRTSRRQLFSNLFAGLDCDRSGGSGSVFRPPATQTQQNLFSCPLQTCVVPGDAWWLGYSEDRQTLRGCLLHHVRSRRSPSPFQAMHIAALSGNLRVQCSIFGGQEIFHISPARVLKLLFFWWFFHISLPRVRKCVFLDLVTAQYKAHSQNRL